MWKICQEERRRGDREREDRDPCVRGMKSMFNQTEVKCKTVESVFTNSL